MNKKYNTSQSLNATQKMRHKKGDTRQNPTGDMHHAKRKFADLAGKHVNNATSKEEKTCLTVNKAKKLTVPGKKFLSPETQTKKLAIYMITLSLISFFLLCLMGCAGTKAYMNPEDYKEPRPKNITYIT